MMPGRFRHHARGLAVLGLGCALLVHGRAGVPGAGAQTPALKAPERCAPLPISPVVTSVKDPRFGAKGDGLTDDTYAIQKAIQFVAGSGETLLIPDGTYLINPIADSGRNGLMLGNRMTLRLAPKAVLQAVGVSAPSSQILVLSGVSEVNVIGGTLRGERARHRGTTGEWGMGLGIYASRHVVIQDVTARDCWGDGFYIGALSQDVTLCNVTADHNRRQGLSITGGDGIVVRNSTFQNTQGTPGESGLDIEPNAGARVNNVLITGCTIRNNGGDGLSSGVPFAHTGSAVITNVVIEGNTISGNGLTPKKPKSVSNGIILSNSIGNRVIGNVCRNNTGRGIFIERDADDTVCTGNIVSGTLGLPGQGIAEDTASGSIITGNTSTGNAGPGIYSVACTGSTIRDNTLAGNGVAP